MPYPLRTVVYGQAYGGPGHVRWVRQSVFEVQVAHLFRKYCSVLFSYHLNPIVQQRPTFSAYIGETPTAFFLWALKRHHWYPKDSPLPYKPSAYCRNLLCMCGC